MFPQVRAAYAARGITCLQCYGTADVGHIAYETHADAPMITDEGVIVEIVTPGTGDPVADGDVGEVVVTALNADYPLIRFATGLVGRDAAEDVFSQAVVKALAAPKWPLVTNGHLCAVHQHRKDWTVLDSIRQRNFHSIIVDRCNQ